MCLLIRTKDQSRHFFLVCYIYWFSDFSSRKSSVFFRSLPPRHPDFLDLLHLCLDDPHLIFIWLSMEMWRGPQYHLFTATEQPVGGAVAELLVKLSALLSSSLCFANFLLKSSGRFSVISTWANWYFKCHLEAMISFCERVLVGYVTTCGFLGIKTLGRT